MTVEALSSNPQALGRFTAGADGGNHTYNVCASGISVELTDIKQRALLELTNAQRNLLPMNANRVTIQSDGIHLQDRVERLNLIGANISDEILDLVNIRGFRGLSDVDFTDQASRERYAAVLQASLPEFLKDALYRHVEQEASSQEIIFPRNSNWAQNHLADHEKVFKAAILKLVDEELIRTGFFHQTMLQISSMNVHNILCESQSTDTTNPFANGFIQANYMDNTSRYQFTVGCILNSEQATTNIHSDQENLPITIRAVLLLLEEQLQNLRSIEADSRFSLNENGINFPGNGTTINIEGIIPSSEFLRGVELYTLMQFQNVVSTNRMQMETYLNELRESLSSDDQSLLDTLIWKYVNALSPVETDDPNWASNNRLYNLNCTYAAIKELAGIKATEQNLPSTISSGISASDIYYFVSDIQRPEDDPLPINQYQNYSLQARRNAFLEYRASRLSPESRDILTAFTDAKFAIGRFPNVTTDSSLEDKLSAIFARHPIARYVNALNAELPINERINELESPSFLQSMGSYLVSAVSTIFYPITFLWGICSSLFTSADMQEEI